MKLKIYWSHRCAGEWANMLFYFSLRTHKSIILLQYLQFGSLRVSRVETNTRIIIVISYEMDLHMFPIHVYVLRTEWERWRTSSQSIQPLTFENSKLNYKRRVLSLSTVGTWLRRRRRWYGITASDIHIHRAWFQRSLDHFDSVPNIHANVTASITKHIAHTQHSANDAVLSHFWLFPLNWRWFRWFNSVSLILPNGWMKDERHKRYVLFVTR